MAVLDDAASIKRLKAVFQEHLDKHDADIGLTPYADDGIAAAPNQLYTTPAPAPVGPPAQAYADGGEVSPYTRFTEDGDRTADAWARYAPKGEYQSYDYLPRFSDPTDLARGVVDAAKGIGRDFANSGYNPARYLIHGADRFGQNYLSGITPQDVADMAVPHDLGDQYGLSGRVADALSTVMPGVGSLAIPPLYEGARYVADKYLPKFGEGGQVSKNLLKMFHGTGRTFDKFDPTMIERGGGTRTYGAGYGHYFTEDPIYAENYHGYGSTPTTLGVTLDQAPNSLLDLDRYMSKTPRLVDRLKGVGSPGTWRGFDWDKKGRSALDQLSNHYGDEEAARRLVSKDFTGTVFDNEFGHGRNIATFPGQEDRIGIVDRHTGTALDDLRNKWYEGLDAADKITPAPMYPNENPQIQYGNIAYAEGGRVSRLIKQITNTRGAFQGERATKAADLANLDRISSNGVLDLFDSDKSSLLTAMPPSKFEDYATRLPITARGVVPYPRFENYPGRSLPKWQDQTYDNYLDKLAQSMKTGPQDRRAYAPGELWMYKNPEDMTEIEGHEGRHRMAALARLGDESGLVHLRPVNPGELNMRPDMEERISDLKQKYFPQGADTPIVPQFTLQSRYNFKGEPQMGKFDITNRDALPLPAAPFKEGGKVLRKLAKAFTEQAEKVRGPDSGFSWHPQTGEPSGGYIASMWPERGQVIPPSELSGPSLQKFYKKNRDLLDLPDHYLGAWHDPESGQIYVDVSKHGGDLNDIAMQARAANQKSIFDLGNFETIDTGGTGAPLRAPPTYGPGFREGGVVNKLARKFLVDPVRERFPGIYQDPDKLVEQAKKRFVPDEGTEGSMYRLFGHTRDSLDDLSQGNRDLDSITPFLKRPPFNLSGTARNSPQVLTNRNANRLVDTIGAGLEDPAIRATRSWYEMSPMYDRMRELGTGDKAMRDLNTRMSVMSAGSDPQTEINRGFYANWLAGQGRLEDFVRHGATPDHERGSDFPSDMMGLRGHAYHNTAQVPNLLDYENTGQLWPANHKVPTYTAATDPKFPFSDRPVADSHFSRILGYPDVSTAATDAERKGTMSGTQYSDMVPWFRDKVAGKLDMRPRDAQALLWNLGGPQTGVRYIGPSKLEMISNYMDQTAKELGISPDLARDKLLTGEIGGASSHAAPFKRGGEVEDFFNEFQAMNYRKGGPARDPDDVLNYHPLFFRRGGKYKAP